MEREVDRDPTPIPYFAHDEMVTRLAFSHEGDMDRMDRVNKRLVVALVLTIVLMFLSNAIWLYEWMQYDYTAEDEFTTTSYEQDGSGTNIMGNHNEVNNGTEGSDDHEAEIEVEDPEIVTWK